MAAVAYDVYNKRLVTAGTKVRLWPMRVTDNKQLKTISRHLQRTTNDLLNDLFPRLSVLLVRSFVRFLCISVCQESTRRGGPAHNNLIVAVCFSEIFNQLITCVPVACMPLLFRCSLLSGAILAKFSMRIGETEFDHLLAQCERGSKGPCLEHL